MQSAFVDIGLERDAFLYVTDFLLEEDEEVDVIDQGTSRPARGPVQRTEERYAPIEADEFIPPAELVAHTPNEQTAETRESAPGQLPQRQRPPKSPSPPPPPARHRHFPTPQEHD